MAEIKTWMKDKTILITGGAGFMGKALVEKLLRSCPDLKRIYLIIRKKRGLTPQERWKDLLKNELFEKLLSDAPDIIDRKVTVLDGDMSLINLGLSEATIEELKNTVNIVYHSAATVQFNNYLHDAFLTNLRGTLELCNLATEMKSLNVFVYVSTTYCNFNLKKNLYEEKIYEPNQDWRTIVKLMEKEDPAVVNTISYKITEDHPNTYTFTKSLSEKLVEDYSSKFPTVIARPSVVVGALNDPIPGWTDSLNGAYGFTTGVCKGIIRVMKANENSVLDCVPVDLAINAIIVSSWDKATSENTELSIYNCAYLDFVPGTVPQLLEAVLELNKTEWTFDNDIWYPFVILTLNEIYFYLLFFLLQLIPALFLDSILFLMNKERRLLKITIKLYNILQASKPFLAKRTIFDTKTYRVLWDKVPEDGTDLFRLRPPSNLNSKKLLTHLHKGVLKYLKEDVEHNEKNRKKLWRLYYMDRFVRGIIISALFMLIYKLISRATYRYIL